LTHEFLPGIHHRLRCPIIAYEVWQVIAYMLRPQQTAPRLSRDNCMGCHYLEADGSEKGNQQGITDSGANFRVVPGSRHSDFMSVLLTNPSECYSLNRRFLQ
jgi:hypothetical protein